MTNNSDTYETLRRKLFVLKYEMINPKHTERTIEEIEEDIKKTKKELAKLKELQLRTDSEEKERKNVK